jgi:Flp pilus assembly protein CpaB
MVTDRLMGPEVAAGSDPSTPAKRSLLSRIKLGHVVMALAALLALVFNLAILSGNRATTEVAVAAGDIRAGTALTMSHFTVAEVPADDLLSSRFVPGDSLDSAVGKLTTRSIAAGEPILEADLLALDSRDGLRAMSIPIDQERAVGGHLSTGDSVDIVMVVDGVASYIATSVEVLEVPSRDSNALGAQTGYAPTVAVDAEQALRIAAALDTGEVHLIRATGSALPDLEQARAVDESQQQESEGTGG